MRKRYSGKYRLVRLVTLEEHESIKTIEEMFHLQSKFYSEVNRYAVYRQDKHGNWVAWLDPADIVHLIEGKLNVDNDDDLQFEDETHDPAA